MRRKDDERRAPLSQAAARTRSHGGSVTYLLHDTGLALREGDVATRLVLDELDLDLPALAAGLVFIVVVVVGSRTWALGAAVRIAAGQLAVAVVVERRRRVLVVLGDLRGHGVARAVLGCGCLASAFGGPNCVWPGVCVGRPSASVWLRALRVTGKARRVQLSDVGLGPGR